MEGLGANGKFKYLQRQAVADMLHRFRPAAFSAHMQGFTVGA